MWCFQMQKSLTWGVAFCERVRTFLHLWHAKNQLPRFPKAVGLTSSPETTPSSPHTVPTHVIQFELEDGVSTSEILLIQHPLWWPHHAPQSQLHPWALGCSDFHIFPQCYQVSPIPAFFRTLVFRKYQKKDCHFCHLGRIFFLLFQKSVFFLKFSKPIF